MLKQIADLSAELAAKDHIGIDNILDVVRDVHPLILQELDVVQKRQLIYQELEKLRARTTREAKALFGMNKGVLLNFANHFA